MPRRLPVLLMQCPGNGEDDWAEVFGATLRTRLAEFPDTRLAAYPELHLCPPGTQSDMERRAEPLDGPRVKFLRELATELGIWLVPGSVYERAEDGRIYNTAVAISPQGELVAAYRKCFPWRPWERTTPGSQFVVFDIPGTARIGLSICYDTWFPEVGRHLAWMGAEVILQLTHTPTVDRAQELILSRATAIANQAYVVSLNASAPVATGRSLIVHPEGQVLLEAGEGTVALTHVLDLDQVEITRTFGTAGLNRVWHQARPGDPRLDLPLYGGVLDPLRWRIQRHFLPSESP